MSSYIVIYSDEENKFVFQKTNNFRSDAGAQSFCIYKPTGVNLHNLSSNALWIYTPFLFERHNSGSMLPGLWKLTKTLSIAETSSFSTTYI